VLVPSLWPVQIRLWRQHTPDPAEPARCAAAWCRQTWQCASWYAADGQLGDAVAAHRRLIAGLAAGTVQVPATFTTAEIAAAARAVERFRARRQAVTR